MVDERMDAQLCAEQGMWHHSTSVGSGSSFHSWFRAFTGVCLSRSPGSSPAPSSLSSSCSGEVFGYT